MSSAPTPVPLTTHNLPQEDRSRLIRSTRKIQKVVGETPHFVDFPPLRSSSRTKKRSRYRYTPDVPLPAPTAPLDPSSDARPLLYIRVPDAPPPEPAPVSPAPSPTLTVALNLRNAAGYVVKDDAARRRKMAKLFRTLGVPVPPELVFPPTSSKERRARRLTARTVMSDRAESITGGRIERWRSGVSTTPPKERKPKVDSISHGWVWVGRAAEIPADVRVRVRPGSRLPPDWVSVDKPGDIGVDDEPQGDIVEEPRTAVSAVRAMHRREEGWSGEWKGAVRNMDDVVRSLRDLKAK